MADDNQWAFPEELRPRRDEVAFDLDRALDAMLLLRAAIPPEAFTAELLGTERAGYAIVIGTDGLVLTIGYLITEAQTLWLSTNRGTTVPGTVLAYDQATGFGLVQPLSALNVAPLPIGSAADLTPGDTLYVLGHGGLPHALKTRLLAKREFAGYWEYVLDEALFTSPAHPQWGGSALVDAAGRLVGVGSLLVQEQEGNDDEPRKINMFVPIDLLGPLLPSMRATGSSGLPPRPWLGLYVQEADGQLVVGALAQGGPADRAGVRPADLVIGVGDERVRGLAAFFRRVWAQGPAGVEVPLTLAREGDVLRVKVRSADRNDFLWKPRLH
ncbi:MAG: serine protease [Burkholderiales bacterium]|nr:serine protease [Burkholderiales bacterium]